GVVFGDLAAATAAPARVGRDAERGGEQERTLAPDRDARELARGHPEDLLGTVVDLGHGDAEAAQRTPDEIELLLNDRGEPPFVGGGQGISIRDSGTVARMASGRPALCVARPVDDRAEG
ncbi:MAG TPA: hypothetical protein VGM56_18625, partial [Byssovorax sp.]